MATVAEIKEAVGTARKAGAGEIALLHCVSSYPAEPKEMNLRTIPDLAKRFQCTVGLSDHSAGPNAAIAAVCMGAKVVEKHFILDKKIKTPDSFFSIDPAELKDLIRQIRVTEEMLGDVSYDLSDEEAKNRVFRRSLFITEDVRKGETLTEKNMRSIRPAHGLEPKFYSRVLGKKAVRDIKRGTPLSKGLYQ